MDDGHTEVGHIQGLVEFRNVSFAYPSRPQVTIFKDLNFRVDAGSSLALVGASGSGKSSILALIERFYDPDAGVVMVDGQDIRSFKVQTYRLHVALVEQEPGLFTGSIYDNITCGSKDGKYTEEDVIEASQVAGVDTFVSALPSGYKTSVGERGVQLSGGQKQRVAIARAVMKKPAILLLDEATSALDSESEKAVQKALNWLMKDRTTIVVAHRLSTVWNADQIAVVQDGKIIEQGTHQELVSRPDGAYSKLVSLQQQQP